MYIVPATNWMSLNLSESETRFVQAVGERAVLRQLVTQFNLSIPAAWAKVQHLASKGALKVINA